MSKWQADSSQTVDDMAAMSEAGEEQLLAAAQQFDAVALGELYLSLIHISEPTRPY